jgi:hypothetical protein
MLPGAFLTKESFEGGNPVGGDFWQIHTTSPSLGDEKNDHLSSFNP